MLSQQITESTLWLPLKLQNGDECHACFSHTLQLSVEVVLKLSEVSCALARCRHFVAHFSHSVKSSYLLKQKQIDLQHKSPTILQDVSTHWNVAYYMAKCLLSQQQPLCVTLLELYKGDMMPSDMEFTTLELFVKVMKPLVDITEAFGAESWVTTYFSCASSFT